MHAYGGDGPSSEVDNDPIKYSIYAVLRAALQQLPYDPVVHDFSPTPRLHTPLQATIIMSDALVNTEWTEWEAILKAVDTPWYRGSSAAIVYGALSLIFTPDLAVRMGLPLAETANLLSAAGYDVAGLT